MNKVKAELKDRLREALELREKKSIDLVRDLNIPKSAISQYLSGKSQNMDSKRLYAICKYLNVNEPWLMGYDVQLERTLEEIEAKPKETAERHFEMIMDKDFVELFEDFKLLDERERTIVKNLAQSLAETKRKP